MCADRNAAFFNHCNSEDGRVMTNDHHSLRLQISNMCICLLYLTSVWVPLCQLFFLWFFRLGTRLCLGMPGSAAAYASVVVAISYHHWCHIASVPLYISSDAIWCLLSIVQLLSCLVVCIPYIICYNLSHLSSYYHCTVQLTPRTVRIMLSLLIPNTERKFKGRVLISELHWKGRWCIVIMYSKSCIKADR